MKHILQTLISIVLLFSLSQNAICETMATVDAGRGDVSLYIPNSYDSEKPLPLIVALHGFTGSSESIKKYWRMNRLVDEKQFIFCIPDGTKNTRDQRFWNATKACCDFETGAVDDSGYLRSLIELIEKKYAVDPKSIHFLGHSNGGFMSLRMACEHADKIASVQSLAGAMFLIAEDHKPTEPVHVLQVHGTEDKIIKYDGGVFRSGQRHPSARETVEMWAKFNACAQVPEQLGTFDLVSSIDGEDTTVLCYKNDETKKMSELWTIHGGSHSPRFNQSYSPKIIDWLLAHRKN
ncbi:MAG: alpha/beta fold hydrolase [Phycisphaerales bacterium]|nr:alpha/beta fold hydrolase [Phycisphaerales bacterium]